MAGGIFVSYRRDSFRHAAGRFHDKLALHFARDQIFMDVDAIEPGLDFVKVLHERVGTCNVLVAVISPLWLDAKDEAGQRRLDNPDDFVRIELEAALARDVRVVPVLVGGAAMPKESELPSTLKPFARRNAVVLNHTTFGRDMDALIKVLEKDVRPNAKGWFGGRAPGSALPEPVKRPLNKPDVSVTTTATGQASRKGGGRIIVAGLFALGAIPFSLAVGGSFAFLKLNAFASSTRDDAVLTGYAAGTALIVIFSLLRVVLLKRAQTRLEGLLYLAGAGISLSFLAWPFCGILGIRFLGAGEHATGLFAAIILACLTSLALYVWWRRQPS